MRNSDLDDTLSNSKWSEMNLEENNTGRMADNFRKGPKSTIVKLRPEFKKSSLLVDVQSLRNSRPKTLSESDSDSIPDCSESEEEVHKLPRYN